MTRLYSLFRYRIALAFGMIRPRTRKGRVVFTPAKEDPRDDFLRQPSAFRLHPRAFALLRCRLYTRRSRRN